MTDYQIFSSEDFFKSIFARNSNIMIMYKPCFYMNGENDTTKTVYKNTD